jgi:hypothetical protein
VPCGIDSGIRLRATPAGALAPEDAGSIMIGTQAIWR